jgi:hypothetical protein
MLRHVVMWTLKGDTPEDRAAVGLEISERMRELVGVIPSIRGLRIDGNERFPLENADLVLTMDFDDMAGYEAYRDHPAHLEVGSFIRPRYVQRMAVDHDV